MPKLATYADAELGAYGYDEKDWFLPHVRLQRFLEELDAQGLRDAVEFRKAPPASDQDLHLFHAQDYVQFVTERCASNTGALDHGPTFARTHMERAARHVVGAVLDAARHISQGNLKKAFVPIAGFHHAYSDEARLYCLYNDPVIALFWFLAHYEGNVAYIDIDVHQGDGVYKAFEAEPRVHIVDIHEDPKTLFPNTPESPAEGHMPGRREEAGAGAAVGTKLNIPLEPFTTDDQYLEIWEEAESFIRAAKPEVIVFESGVDCLRGDPLSNQHISLAAIKEVTLRVKALADECADGRLLVLGGGGYDLDNVGMGWATVVRALTS